MKNPIFSIIGMLVFTFVTASLSAQLSSKLDPDELRFMDGSNLFAGANFTIGGIHIQNGFSSTDITNSLVSAGDDLQRAKINAGGLTVEDFALFPGSKGNFGLRELTFSTLGDNDEEVWRAGLSNIGDFNGGDPVASEFSLQYSRTLNNFNTTYTLLYGNPYTGTLTVGSYGITADASLFVHEPSTQQVSAWMSHEGASDNSTWGTYSRTYGGGIGARFGVHGVAESGTGTKYGVYGGTDGVGTTYGVFASGNLAYTGTFSNVSDRKFKKDIKPFAALDRVLKLQPRSFSMKREEFKRMNLADGLQFGFIAQELQEVFPELVHQQMNITTFEEEPGKLNTEEIDYLGVDYLSMVPILTQAIKEQQELLEDKNERIGRLERDYEQMQRDNRQMENRLDELEQLLREMQEGQSVQENTQTGTLHNARLEQNQPNPFSRSTTVPYFIPDTVQRAELRFTDAAGRVLQSILVSGRGQGQTILETDQLSQGIYYYSLVLDGELVDTKKMQAVR